MMPTMHLAVSDATLGQVVRGEVRVLLWPRPLPRLDSVRLSAPGGDLLVRCRGVVRGKLTRGRRSRQGWIVALGGRA
jgi:hypothetical protein